MPHRSRAVAVVMGDLELVRALALGGIDSVLSAPPDERARYSRHVHAAFPPLDPWTESDALVDAILRFAERRPERPALLFQTDGDLLLVSRHRARLAEALVFAIADAELVEALVDKQRFQELAARHDLPVPASQRIGTGGSPSHALVPPVVVKPLTRSPRWTEFEPDSKAVLVATTEMLERVHERLVELGLQALAQELVPGPESRVESYHAYIAPDGETVAEFTGRKIRTAPAIFGHSTSVAVTEIGDVRELGREIFRRIGLVGVAKADFKRAPDGSLWLLEINPRFNLWHLPAAVSGTNLPALVVADLTGRPRAAVGPPPCATWCRPVRDLAAARNAGESLASWARFALRCDVLSSVALDDPMPFVRGALARRAAGVLRGR